MRRELEVRLEACPAEIERAKLIDAHKARVRRMNIRFPRTGLYPRRDSEQAGSRTTGPRGTRAKVHPQQARSSPPPLTDGAE
jgi:hypothetical protein